MSTCQHQHLQLVEFERFFQWFQEGAPTNVPRWLPPVAEQVTSCRECAHAARVAACLLLASRCVSADPGSPTSDCLSIDDIGGMIDGQREPDREHLPYCVPCQLLFAELVQLNVWIDEEVATHPQKAALQAPPLGVFQAAPRYWFAAACLALAGLAVVLRSSQPEAGHSWPSDPGASVSIPTMMGQDSRCTADLSPSEVARLSTGDWRLAVSGISDDKLDARVQLQLIGELGGRKTACGDVLRNGDVLKLRQHATISKLHFVDRSGAVRDAVDAGSGVFINLSLATATAVPTPVGPAAPEDVALAVVNEVAEVTGVPIDRIIGSVKDSIDAMAAHQAVTRWKPLGDDGSQFVLMRPHLDGTRLTENMSKAPFDSERWMQVTLIRVNGTEETLTRLNGCMTFVPKSDVPGKPDGWRRAPDSKDREPVPLGKWFGVNAAAGKDFAYYLANRTSNLDREELSVLLGGRKLHADFLFLVRLAPKGQSPPETERVK